jgi:hypothetical protein
MKFRGCDPTFVTCPGCVIFQILYENFFKLGSLISFEPKAVPKDRESPLPVGGGGGGAGGGGGGGVRHDATSPPLQNHAKCAA